MSTVLLHLFESLFPFCKIGIIKYLPLRVIDRRVLIGKVDNLAHREDFNMILVHNNSNQSKEVGIPSSLRKSHRHFQRVSFEHFVGLALFLEMDLKQQLLIL